MRTYFNFPQQKVIVIDGNNSKMFTLDEYNKKINKWRKLNRMVKLNELIEDLVPKLIVYLGLTFGFHYINYNTFTGIICFIYFIISCLIFGFCYELRRKWELILIFHNRKL